MKNCFFLFILEVDFLMKLASRNLVSFPKLVLIFLHLQHYISVAVLIYTAIIQSFICIAQLGFSFIAVIGLGWFVNQSEVGLEKEH